MKRPHVKAVIEDVIADTGKFQPIIVTFQNGELKDEGVQKISCGLFRSKTDRTVLAMSNGHIVYKGNRPNFDKESVRTMLLLHNKVTGKARLLETERWQVCPVLDKFTADKDTNNTEDKIAILNKQFGSKQVRRKTEQFERMKVNIDAVKDQLEKSASSIKIDKVDLSNQLSPEECISSALLPPCNRNASNVKDVYNVNDIIPRDKIETLYDHAAEVLDGSRAKEKTQFFRHTLKKVQSDPDKVHKVALLLYIEMINTWFAMPMKEAKKRDSVACSVSETVNRHIIETYSIPSSNGRLRPNIMKDKGLVHCLILALMVSNFELNVELFRVMLTTRTSMKKLMDLAKIIGATTTKEDRKTIKLKVPLPEPTALVRRGRKSAAKT